MTFRLRIVCCLAGALGGLCPLASWAQNRVTLPAQREAILANLDEILRAQPGDFGSIPRERVNPFMAVMPARAPVPVAVAPDRPAPVVQATETQGRLDDEAALAAIVANFRPSGSIILGERRLLRMADGSMLQQGSTFTARIRGEAYSVQVARVLADGYTLALGNARHTARFIDSAERNP